MSCHVFVFNPRVALRQVLLTLVEEARKLELDSLPALKLGYSQNTGLIHPTSMSHDFPEHPLQWQRASMEVSNSSGSTSSARKARVKGICSKYPKTMAFTPNHRLDS